MTHTTGSEARLEDVLYELSMASASPGADLLDDFVRHYPQFASELTDFAVELALDALKSAGDEAAAAPAQAGVSPAVGSAISRLHNRLHAAKQRRQQRHSSKPADPFSALSRNELRAFGDAIHANIVFVAKLRDRLISLDTIPAELRRQAAQHLHVPEELLAAYWNAPPQIQQAAKFKSEQKPEAVKQQTFAEAVASSHLSDEQKRYLLGLK